MVKIYESLTPKMEVFKFEILFKLSFCDIHKEPSTRMLPPYVQRDAWSGWTLLVFSSRTLELWLSHAPNALC